MRSKWKLTGALGAAGVLAAAVAAVGYSTPPGSTDFTNVANPQPRTVGVAAPSALSAELDEVIVAQGSMKLDGGTAANPYYGYDGNRSDGAGAQLATPRRRRRSPTRTRTSCSRTGSRAPTRTTTTAPTSSSRVMSSGSPGFITRVNLDADAAHRVTLLASKDVGGNDLKTIDGLDLGSVVEDAAVHDGEHR